MITHTKVSELSAPVTAKELYNNTRPFELAEICSALEKEIRGIKFSDYSSKEVVVYREGDAYTMGRVGFMTVGYTIGGDPIDKFVVTSPHIENNKYSICRHEHRQKVSSTMATAVKNAKKYLRSYTPTMLFDVTAHRFANAVDDARKEVRRTVSSIKDKLFGTEYTVINDGLMRELQAMVNSGYEFVDSQVREDLQTYFTANDEFDKFKTQRVTLYFIRVKQQFGEQLFDVLRMDNVSSFNFLVGKDKEYAECREDTLPDGVMGKLAVLQMMTSETFVEDVGCHMGDGLFYVVQ